GSAAAVCRDDAGNYLGSSSLVIEGQTDPATLEAIACREALALAEDLLLHDFIISSDCKQVVEDINRGNQGRYGSVITEIRLRLLNFDCNFIFEGRATNGEAHSLAKHSLSLGLGRHTWLLSSHDPNCIPLHMDY
uniref:RNase H type-1 domain-containing protein n=1 Tax=Triticum urartu TaxID=4572 RepID=A0A8R7U541_TRIUA